MLVLKKMSTKKMAIYVSIIILMLGGIGFTLYQNTKSTGGSPSAIHEPAMNSNLAAEGDVPGAQAETNQLSTDSLKPAAAPSQTSGASGIKKSEAADLDIFSSEKFKELRENALIIQENSGLGKRDPFKPN